MVVPLLSKFDFHLDYLPGKKNPVDPLSRRPDYEPQPGDPVLTGQKHTILMPSCTAGFFPTPSISTVSITATFTFPAPDLLDVFQTAYHKDPEWHVALEWGDPVFR